MSLAEPFVVRARCHAASAHPIAVEIPIPERRPSFAAMLQMFADMSGTQQPPPGYELAIRQDYIGRKFVFGADSTVLIAPPSWVLSHIEPRPNESLVLALQQPEDESSGNRSFLRAGITLFADHDLGDLVYARTDCVWFEHEGAMIVPDGASLSYPNDQGDMDEVVDP